MAADVLVIGGGPAATWAAVAAAQAEARVILVDKGYVGTSGATAPANTGTWSPPPGERRQAAIAARHAAHRRSGRPGLGRAHAGHGLGEAALPCRMGLSVSARR